MKSDQIGAAPLLSPPLGEPAPAPLALADLFNDVASAARLLAGELRREASLDAFLLAAGVSHGAP